MRKFIAIPLPDEVKRKTGEILETLRGVKGLATVKPSNLHLTLLFLGDEGTENQFRRLGKISFRPFDLTIQSVELFPGIKPRLVWLGLEKKEELFELHKKVSGIFGINEQLRAHITLSRIKSLNPENKKIMLETVTRHNPLAIHFSVDHFNLYKSELKPEGPEYTVIATCPATSA
jgi:RNA 2',3'-cyclic 3'-phosphodiesterase